MRMMRVAALPLRVPRRDDREQLGGDRRPQDEAGHVAASRQVAALAEGDEPLGQPPGLLGLLDGGLDTLVLEQRGDEIAQHRAPVGRGAAQLAMVFAVSHVSPIPSRPAPPAVSSRVPDQPSTVGGVLGW
jgi:hypothetical protein